MFSKSNEDAVSRVLRVLNEELLPLKDRVGTLERRYSEVIERRLDKLGKGLADLEIAAVSPFARMRTPSSDELPPADPFSRQYPDRKKELPAGSILDTVDALVEYYQGNKTKALHVRDAAKAASTRDYDLANTQAQIWQQAYERLLEKLQAIIARGVL